MGGSHYSRDGSAQRFDLCPRVLHERVDQLFDEATIAAANAIALWSSVIARRLRRFHPESLAPSPCAVDQVGRDRPAEALQRSVAA